MSTANLKPNFIFFGTDEFAVGVLDELARHDWLPRLIISTPDTPQGRNLVLTPPPVKVWALARQISFLQPANLSDPDFASSLQAPSSQLFVVAAYGKIIPKIILGLPPHGTLNIHPSLLPKYRGPSPLQTAILNGDSETGVSIIKLDEELDHGPLLATRNLELGTRNFAELRDALAKLGAELFIKTAPDYLAGKIAPVEQDHAQASFTKKFTKADAEIKLSDPADLNYRKILALNPNPGTWFTSDNGTRIKILSARLENNELKLDRVIPAGKKEMGWEDYRRGRTAVV